MKDKIFAACTGIVCCYCAKEFDSNLWCKDCVVNFLRKKAAYTENREERNYQGVKYDKVSDSSKRRD